MKGLEALSNLESFKKMKLSEIKYFEIIEKELKALEIIKNKKVNVSRLFNSDNAKVYNKELFLIGGYLTQEEFDLLREVLGE